MLCSTTRVGGVVVEQFNFHFRRVARGKHWDKSSLGKSGGRRETEARSGFGGGSSEGDIFD